MKSLLIAVATLGLLASPVLAQPMRHDDNRPGPTMGMQGPGMRSGMNHSDWHKGGRIARNDWNRGQRVTDYNRYHLSRPPRGYEWRRVDNNYVLAAAATGLIAGLVLANQ